MIARLSMYTTAETRDAYDRFWSNWSERLRAAGLDAPGHLTRDGDDEAAWFAPDLVIAQTCGYPYASRLRGRVHHVATPHYDVDGCDGPNYVSWIVTRAESDASTLSDLRGTRAVINGLGSQSGYNSFRAVVAPHALGGRFFSDVVVSGSHARSMRMVTDGEADCATIDAVSWALTISEHPELATRLKQMGSTPSLPGLPFITSGSRTDVELDLLRSTLHETIGDPSLKDALTTMRLKGASVVPDAAYDACLNMEEAAVATGYPSLA